MTVGPVVLKAKKIKNVIPIIQASGTLSAKIKNAISKDIVAVAIVVVDADIYCWQNRILARDIGHVASKKTFMTNSANPNHKGIIDKVDE